MNTKEQIINVIANLTEDENIKLLLRDNDDLEQLNIDSIKFVRLVVELESIFNIEFEDDFLDFTKFDTLTKLCQYVEKRQNENT